MFVRPSKGQTGDRLRKAVMLLILILLLAGCGGSASSDTSQAVSNAGSSAAGENAGAAGGEKPQEGQAGSGGEEIASGSVPTASARDAGERKKPDHPYEAPDMLLASFHEDKAEVGDRAKIDLSAVQEGYVAVSATSDKKLKFQVVSGDNTYNYDLSSDGTPSIMPLNCGNGEYRFRVMENVTDNKYGELFAVSCTVEMKDEFQPYLRPNDYAPYDKDSACVKKAAELAGYAEDAVGVVAEVYDYVCGAVKYDDEKAVSVKPGYLPSPDETMDSGMGICFDYASLAAAMLRSQGIPVKLIFGYVSPDDLYHAWNMFYTKETGWVTVGFQVKKETWTRLDLTFSANGADEKFIGDGSNYADLYCY